MSSEPSARLNWPTPWRPSTIGSRCSSSGVTSSLILGDTVSGRGTELGKVDWMWRMCDRSSSAFCLQISMISGIEVKNVTSDDPGPQGCVRVTGGQCQSQWCCRGQPTSLLSIFLARWGTYKWDLCYSGYLLSLFITTWSFYLWNFPLSSVLTKVVESKQLLWAAATHNLISTETADPSGEKRDPGPLAWSHFSLTVCVAYYPLPNTASSFQRFSDWRMY